MNIKYPGSNISTLNGHHSKKSKNKLVIVE